MGIVNRLLDKPASEWTLAEYENALQWADWTYEYSDDFEAWSRAKAEFEQLGKVQVLLDPDKVIWNKHDQMKDHNP